MFIIYTDGKPTGLADVTNAEQAVGAIREARLGQKSAKIEATDLLDAPIDDVVRVSTVVQFRMMAGLVRALGGPAPAQQ